MFVDSGNLGRRQERILESLAIITPASPRLHPGSCPGQRTVSPTATLVQMYLMYVELTIIHVFRWFCEPAYDKLRGTEEGIVNSRLYNEKAYVLSRGFVRRALEIPLGSLEAEITWLYRKENRLDKVLGDARALIDKSRAGAEDTGADKDRAVPRLTAGGIITLERTLAKLEGLKGASSSS